MQDTDKGFLRTNLAGAGHTLVEAFANLRGSTLISNFVENPIRKLIGARMNLDPKEGEGYWGFYQFSDDVYVVVCDFHYLKSHYEPIPGEGLLEFHIKLSGSLSLELNRPDLLDVDGPSLLIWNQPEGCDSSVSTGPDAIEKSVSLYCRPSFLRDNIIVDQSSIPIMLKRLLRDEQNSINFCKVPLSIEIVEAASCLHSIKPDEPLGLTYAEAKTLELLYLIVSAFEKLSQGADESYSDNELKQFKLARQIVLEQHCPPPSITQVTRKTGMNKTKLTRGFKSVFGLTLFEFGTQCRMQKALDLLKHSDKQVGLISELLGYEHQTTFTAAFKKYFGFLPKDVRKYKK